MTDDELRTITGRVTDDRPLCGFLYDLLRDHLPAGVVETLVRASEDIGKDNPCTFTNGHLADYAKLLADRLQSPC